MRHLHETCLEVAESSDTLVWNRTEAAVPLSDAARWAHLDPMLQDGPDWHGILHRDNAVAAHGSLWWRQTPAYGHHRVGMLGHFFAASGSDAHQLISTALARLKQEGCTFVVGPMNGGTWRDYRWVTDFGEEPEFVLEPRNPPEYPQYLECEGFRPITRFFSGMDCQLDPGESELARMERRFEKVGVEVRKLSEATFDADIEAIRQVTLVAFRDNPFFDPPDSRAFLRHCQQLRQVAPLDFVQIAFHGQDAVGFVFAIPDLCQAERGLRMDTLVVKTVAVKPSRQYLGLGTLLMARVKRDASARGFRRAIHALMRHDRHLERFSRRTATPFREYTLFGKVLGE